METELLNQINAKLDAIIATRPGITPSALYTYSECALLSQHSIYTIRRAVAATHLLTNGGCEPRVWGRELMRWIDGGCKTGRSLATMEAA